jgi:hypothetical protein
MKKFTAAWLALCAGILGYGLGKHSTEERCFAEFLPSSAKLIYELEACKQRCPESHRESR